MTMIHKWLSMACLCTMVLLMMMEGNFIVAAEKQEIGGVTASFEAKSERYILDASMPVVLSIENTSSEEIFFHFFKRGLEFFTKDASGKPLKRLFPYSRSGHCLARPHRLPPGSTYTESFYLNNWLAFETPGTYTVKCTVGISVTRDKTGGKYNYNLIPVENTVIVTLSQGSDREIQDIIRDLESKLQSKDGKIQDEAARALGSIRVPAVIDALGRALRNGSPLAEWHAAHALVDIGTPEAIEKLINVAKSGGLGAGEPEIVYSLDGSVATSVGRGLGARETAINWLGYSRVKTTMPVLLNLLEDPHRSIRYAALNALSKVGDQSCLDEVQKKLNDPDERVRKQANRTLKALMRK